MELDGIEYSQIAIEAPESYGNYRAAIRRFLKEMEIDPTNIFGYLLPIRSDHLDPWDGGRPVAGFEGWDFVRFVKQEQETTRAFMDRIIGNKNKRDKDGED